MMGVERGSVRSAHEAAAHPGVAAQVRVTGVRPRNEKALQRGKEAHYGFPKGST